MALQCGGEVADVLAELHLAVLVQVPDTEEDGKADLSAGVHGSHAVGDVADVLGQYEVRTGFSQDSRVRYVVVAEPLCAEKLDVGGLLADAEVEGRGGDAAGHVGVGVPCVPRADRVVGGGSSVVLPPVAHADALHCRGGGPEVVADDDVSAHAQVVLVDLLHHVGVVDVRRGGPGLQGIGRALQHVDTPALQLRAGAAVHQQHLASLQPLDYVSGGHLSFSPGLL